MPNDQTPQPEVARCELCGEPMPLGEQRFRYHGYSGPCPRQSPTSPVADLIASWKRHASILAPHIKQRDLFQRGQALADAAEQQQREIDEEKKRSMVIVIREFNRRYQDGEGTVLQVCNEMLAELGEGGDANV